MPKIDYVICERPLNKLPDEHCLLENTGSQIGKHQYKFCRQGQGNQEYPSRFSCHLHNDGPIRGKIKLVCKIPLLARELGLKARPSATIGHLVYNKKTYHL